MHITPLLSQLHPRSVTYASGGGAPCLTAGDARAVARVNPWGGQRGLRRRRRHTESVEGVKRCVSKSGCCATPPVLERGVEFSPRVRPSGITRGYAWCVPSRDSGCGLGGFPFFSLSTSPLLHGFALWASPAVTHGVSPPGTVGAGWKVSLFSPSPLLYFSTSPRVRPLGITRGYAWCVPSGDSGWTMSYFFSY